MKPFIPGLLLTFLLTDVVRLYNQSFEQHLLSSKIRLSPSEVRTLSYIKAFSGMRQVDIAEMMGINSASVCTYCDKLLRRGFITRDFDARDMRSRIPILNDYGDRILDELHSISQAIYRQATHGLPEDQVRAMHSGFTTVLLNLDNRPRVRLI